MTDTIVLFPVTNGDQKSSPPTPPTLPRHAFVSFFQTTLGQKQDQRASEGEWRETSISQIFLLSA